MRIDAFPGISRYLPALFILAGAPLMNAHAQTPLAQSILEDKDLLAVMDRAKAIVATGFNAGDGYGEVWIRDLNTFMDLACAVHPKETVREKLEIFFHFQGDDGNIADGYIPKAQASVGYDFIHSASAPDYAAHKNTVETDQESSLVLGVCRYVRATGDTGFLHSVVNGRTVAQRLEDALRFVRTVRFAEAYGLVWGGATADWGDVQPEHEWGVVLDENSHRAIDIYDNALYLTAIDAFLGTAPDLPAATRQEWTAFRAQVAANVRKHLWDTERKKFIPHVYLNGSPFPADFDENAIYYHGGTAVAIEADLLSTEEVKEALVRMAKNVRDAGAASIGLTMYPAYPAGFFKNPGMAKPYSYQNGGDWAWFGGRMIQQLVRHGLAEEAYRELRPMLRQVLDNDGFYEWFTIENAPRGSGAYRGAAGVLYQAIVMLRGWAEQEIKTASGNG
ncbi:MAG: hypothetical protein HYV27_07965 [Candidatus Hydrogenedentes bacterium]|nr:hypothetical protein [Candidatus Hydrogenedentota bacterium]